MRAERSRSSSGRWLLMVGLTGQLAAFWLLLSGHYTAVLLVLGGASVGLVAWIVRRMDIVDRESIPLHLGWRLPRYAPWLAGAILRSSWQVTRQVWSRRLTLCPAVGMVPAPGLPELSQVIYANSITLTPGTLSLSVSDDGVEVHSLSTSDLEQLRGGGMLARVRRLEEG